MLRRTNRNSGRREKDEWRLNGVLHREDGPALTNYRISDETVFVEVYYRNGKEHRVDGPSGLSYASSGVVLATDFHLDDREVSGEDELYATIVSWSPDRIRYEFERSRYAELLDEGADPVVLAEALWAGVRTIEGLREVHRGAPVEWVRTFESTVVGRQ